MPIYRVYKLQPNGRTVGLPEILDTKDDDTAVEEARRLLDRQPLEIWEQARLIGRLETGTPVSFVPNPEGP